MMVMLELCMIRSCGHSDSWDGAKVTAVAPETKLVRKRVTRGIVAVPAFLPLLVVVILGVLLQIVLTWDVVVRLMSLLLVPLRLLCRMLVDARVLLLLLLVVVVLVLLLLSVLPWWWVLGMVLWLFVLGLRWLVWLWRSVVVVLHCWLQSSNVRMTLRRCRQRRARCGNNVARVAALLQRQGVLLLLLAYKCFVHCSTLLQSRHVRRLGM
mmetsp:Transcript_2777/g.10147  ORF Transcript_2777/g.10147 Transcript_2777/m.10147 type:complete len:210 (-) Transcript_2777:3851-4480(-)